jgi:bifunctional oligoribonuclease and PAP phosphatase NrnA
MTDFTDLKKIISEHTSFVLSTHVNPDADAIGSELALYMFLRKLEKRVKIINHNATPYNLEFLDTKHVIEKFNAEHHTGIINDFEVFILVDLNSAARVKSMESVFRSFKGAKVCIDHHQDPENVFDFIFGGTEYCATSEIVYELIKQYENVDLDYKIADQLYAGIMTDTGSFRFERTSAHVHQIIADLLSRGVNPTEMYDNIYNQFKFGRVKLLGEALHSITLDQTKQIAYMTVTHRDLDKYSASEDDVDGFVNYCLSIQGVKVGILFYELNDGIKISFRSKGDITVNKLAAEFNGGGHINASGARLYHVKLHEIIEKVLHSSQKYLK